MKIYSLTELQVLKIKAALTETISDIGGVLRDHYNTSGLDMPFEQTDDGYTIARLESLHTELLELQAGEMNLNIQDAENILRDNGAIAQIWSVNDIQGKIDDYNEENGTELTMSDEDKLSLLDDVFNYNWDNSENDNHLADKVNEQLSELDKADLEETLIMGWNDYISEIDEPPAEAKAISDVDLTLEGFYNRFQEDIDRYEDL